MAWFLLLRFLPARPAKPAIETTITSDHLQLATKIKKIDNAFTIESFKGQYFDNPFDIQGEINLEKNTDPTLNLKTQLTVDLQDLSLIVPNLAKQLDNIKPTGTVELAGVFLGKVKDWRNWQLDLSAQSPQITLKGYKLQNLSLHCEQRDQFIRSFHLTTNVYDGSFDLNSSVNLANEDLLFQLNAQLTNTDLAKLKLDTPLKNKGIDGLVNASVSLSGPLQGLDRWKGNGAVSVQGHLWEFNLLQGIWKILLIPEFQDIVFTETKANFNMNNGRIYTDDLELKSTNVSLLGKGWIDLDKNLNFDISPQFSEAAIIQSPYLRKGPTAILTQGGYLSIKLSGSLDNPKFALNTSPRKILEKATGTILEGMQGILEDILQ